MSPTSSTEGATTIVHIAAAPDVVLAVLRLTNLDRVLLNHPSVEAAFVGA